MTVTPTRMIEPETDRAIAGQRLEIGHVHLLVVDDDAKILRLCERHLENAASLAMPGTAIKLHLASSGDEAVKVVHQVVEAGEQLACALVDLFMEDSIDGIETTNRIWQLDPQAQCTLVTSAGDLDEAQILERIPARFLDRWDFLAKPFTKFEITQRMRRSLTAWVTHRREELHAAQNDELVARLARSKFRLEETVRERTAELAAQNEELARKNTELEHALVNLESARAMLYQQEKMASIGVLAAGVAHELNNPIGFIHSNLGTLGRYVDKLGKVLAAYDARLPDDPELEELRKAEKLEFVLQDLPLLVQESLEGTDRISKIVRDLKIFAHPAEKPEEADLNECLRQALNIIHNELKYKAQVLTDFGQLPPLRCYRGQLNQVFLNLLVNAGQAIEASGEVRITSRLEDGHAKIIVADTGCGIPENVRSRIFDPFFTTKEVGKGTGLGLSISYDIVRKHGGTITVESEVGKGTAFTILLPLGGVEVAS